MDNSLQVILGFYLYVNKKMREAEIISQKTKSIFTQILKEIKERTGNPDK